MSKVTITGNTYPVREQLRALGGRWNAAEKGWDVPAEKADDARALVAGNGPVRGPPASSGHAVSYAKLPDGSWGIRGKGLVTGRKVTVTKKSGETADETVSVILSTDADGIALASVIARPKPAGRSGGGGRRYDAPVKGCGECRRLGHMCKQCRFDEYDD